MVLSWIKIPRLVKVVERKTRRPLWKLCANRTSNEMFKHCKLEEWGNRQYQSDLDRPSRLPGLQMDLSIFCESRANNLISNGLINQIEEILRWIVTYTALSSLASNQHCLHSASNLGVLYPHLLLTHKENVLCPVDNLHSYKISTLCIYAGVLFILITK